MGDPEPFSVNQVAMLQDGRLVFSSPEKDGLYLLDESSDVLADVVPDYKKSWSAHWAVSGNALYFARFKRIVKEGGKVLAPGLH
mgnify:FL=1